MPNWTYNSLKVRDESQLSDEQIKKDNIPQDVKSREELKKFVEENIFKKKIYDEDGNVTGEQDEYELTFQGSVPRPKSLDITSPARTDEEKRIAEDNLKKYGHKNWYDWNIDNWGCKWDANCHSVEDDSGYGEVHIHFETPWCPPLEWLEKVSARYPTLQFDMNVEEESNAFIGNPIAQGGVVCENMVDIHYP
mgnify:FL=1